MESSASVAHSKEQYWSNIWAFGQIGTHRWRVHQFPNSCWPLFAHKQQNDFTEGTPHFAKIDRSSLRHTILETGTDADKQGNDIDGNKWSYDVNRTDP